MFLSDVMRNARLKVAIVNRYHLYKGNLNTGSTVSEEVYLGIVEATSFENACDNLLGRNKEYTKRDGSYYDVNGFRVYHKSN